MLLELARHPVLYFNAVVAVFLASLELARVERRCSFDELVAELRRSKTAFGVRSGPWPQARVVGRLAPLLPPWGMGRCLKRSLILLHLWSAQGLAPRLHLGVDTKSGSGLRGHAWLTVDDPDLAAYCGGPAGHSEALVL